MYHKKHIPVLLEEVIELLGPKPGDRYLDLTAGYGGHASRVIERISDTGKATLVDRDSYAVKHLKKAFANNKQVHIIHQDFYGASQKIHDDNQKFDIILADLGISSPHIDNPERGFSVNFDGPLDMRMDISQAKTADNIINQMSEEELKKILAKYGELNNPRVVAEAIVSNRPFQSTAELAELIATIKPRKPSQRLHPATQVFLAVRIEVNNELQQVEKSLPIWTELLNPGGRIGVISFHSLEDRIVKRFFKDYGGNRYDAPLQTVNKKPVTGSAKEVVFNPRARSAKLRVAQRK